jgi:hypothetical protein
MDRMLMKRRSCTFRYNGLLFEWNENKYKKRKTAPKSTSMAIFVKSPLEDRYEGIDHKKPILLLHEEKCTSHN